MDVLTLQKTAVMVAGACAVIVGCMVLTLTLTIQISKNLNLKIKRIKAIQARIRSRQIEMDGEWRLIRGIMQKDRKLIRDIVRWRDFYSKWKNRVHHQKRFAVKG